MFPTVEADESAIKAVFCSRSFVDDICLEARALRSVLLPSFEFTKCRISICFTNNIFVQPEVDYLSHKVTAHGVTADPTKLKNDQ